MTGLHQQDNMTQHTSLPPKQEEIQYPEPNSQLEWIHDHQKPTISVSLLTNLL